MPGLPILANSCHGGGRKALVETNATLLDDLLALVSPSERGDPMSPLRWTCKGLRRLAKELGTRGHKISHTVVGELLKQHGFKPPLVVHLVIDTALILRRITGRRMCKVDGEIYNIFERPPKVADRCDHDGGELVQRPDDREEIVAPRLAAYDRQTAPLAAYYRRLGRLRDVDASKSVDEVAKHIMDFVRGAR